MWDAHIDIPRDCSMVVFGDSDWAVAYRPPLSVISSDLGTAGARLTHQVLQTLIEEEPEPVPDLAPARFIRRPSIDEAPTARR
jgi:DNA-binding LacI/PurR family transcriptional regulator